MKVLLLLATFLVLVSILQPIESARWRKWGEKLKKRCFTDKKCERIAENQYCKKSGGKWSFWGTCTEKTSASLGSKCPKGVVCEVGTKCDRRTKTCVSKGKGSESDSQKLPKECSLPKAVGTCQGKLPRYFYDNKDNECKKFYYGGCRGNKNNFKKQSDCEKKCKQDDNECQQVLCKMLCPNGYVKDKDGCDICQCLPTDPPTKPPVVTCTIEEKEYQVGISIPNKDPCKDCRCGKEGKQECVTKACDMPICATGYEIYTQEGACCPGCRKKEEVTCTIGGVVYKVGEDIPNSDACLSCHCETTGEQMCRADSCPAPECDEPITEDGECCPKCPKNEPTCTIGGVVYKVDEDIPNSDACLSCHCDTTGEEMCRAESCPAPECDEVHMFTEDGECCSKCRKNEPCPDMMCARYCESYVRDGNGCKTCTCEDDTEPCPEVRCASPCEKYARDENGCQTCTCEPKPPSCDDHKCASGEKCELQDVQCITTPCPPQPTCVTVNPCDTVRCPAGTKCELQDVTCITSPCPPQPTCVPVPAVNPCDTVTCKDGKKCMVMDVQCKRAPCKPVTACVADRATEEGP